MRTDEDPILLEKQLRKASAEGRVDDVKLLLQEVSASAKNESGSTPLHEAAFAGHVEVCQALLANGAEVQELDQWGATALHHAASRGQRAVARLLLSSQADVNAMTSNLQMPIDLAKAKGHIDLAEELQQEALRCQEVSRQHQRKACLRWSATFTGTFVVLLAGLYCRT
ncbi:ankrd52 [Symbiodinium natans]|uniref:Ankrd52 protein n=1 Tax=Symbiodinium natans TaxID=878477 RepID=A0A812SGY2_9DINO|nr:ankrd52 [Symbiodinium natans]